MKTDETEFVGVEKRVQGLSREERLARDADALIKIARNRYTGRILSVADALDLRVRKSDDENVDDLRREIALQLRGEKSGPALEVAVVVENIVQPEELVGRAALLNQENKNIFSHEEAGDHLRPLYSRIRNALAPIKLDEIGDLVWLKQKSNGNYEIVPIGNLQEDAEKNGSSLPHLAKKSLKIVREKIKQLLSTDEQLSADELKSYLEYKKTRIAKLIPEFDNILYSGGGRFKQILIADIENLISIAGQLNGYDEFISELKKLKDKIKKA